MTTQERLIAHQRNRDAAIARAHELRSQAIQAFWSALADAVKARWTRVRVQRRSGRAVEGV